MRPNAGKIEPVQSLLRQRGLSEKLLRYIVPKAIKTKEKKKQSRLFDAILYI